MLEILAAKMAGLFLLAAFGFIIAKRALLSTDQVRGLAWVVIDVTMPALFFTGLLHQDVKALGNMSLLAVGGILLCTLGWLLGLLALRLYGKSIENKGTFLFLCAIGNSSFLPLPLCQALWGNEGTAYCLFFVLGSNLFLFTMGIRLMRGSLHLEKGFKLKDILHPQALATAAGLGLALGGVVLPSWLDGSLTSLGQATIPLAMLATGALLGATTSKSIENKGILGTALLVKLAALPLIVAISLKMLGIHGVSAGVLLLEAAMPCLASSAVYAARFGGNVKLGAEGSFWSHLAALATFPVFMALGSAWGLF
jgi:predicted permease